jgi:hypothetical protein
MHNSNNTITIKHSEGEVQRTLKDGEKWSNLKQQLLLAHKTLGMSEMQVCQALTPFILSRVPELFECRHLFSTARQQGSLFAGLTEREANLLLAYSLDSTPVNIFHTPSEKSNPVSGRDTVNWVDVPKGVTIPQIVEPCTPANIIIFENTSFKTWCEQHSINPEKYNGYEFFLNAYNVDEDNNVAYFKELSDYDLVKLVLSHPYKTREFG